MKIKIKKARLKETDKCLELVNKTFDKFEAPLYGEQGTACFKRFTDYENIYKLVKEKRMKIYKATLGKQLVGVMAVMNLSHVSLLFVDENFHRRGIATALLDVCVRECKRRAEYQKFLTLNAAPAAYKFYKSYGFEAKSSEQVNEGIIFTPMEYALDKKTRI